MLQYLAEQSATHFISQDNKRIKIQGYINQANILQKEYEQLEREQRDLAFARQISAIHQSNRQINAKSYVNTAYYNFQKNRTNNLNYQEIQKWLTKLQQWGIKGYKVIVEMRQTITEQQLIYHIQSDDNSFSYTLTEEQYLKLLAGNQISMTYASTEKLNEAVRGGIPMGDLFKLSVGATRSKIKELSHQSEKEGMGSIAEKNLKNDALYQYLSADGGAIKTNTGGVSHSRIFELHSQLSAVYEWSRNSDGSIKGPEGKNKKTSQYFFTKTRENAVKRFIKKYMDANMHKDNIAFYKTGDAIQDEKTLIENKVGNAVVSLSTIKNAIKEIANMKNITSAAELKKAFIKMFTYSGKGFEKKIQNSAKNFAIKNINELFKKIT